ncbi:MAG: hypothetical protein JWO05_2154 [Gemmatimonadetes bacterium]|nr:hypothetical protein [Gemmatimonadota bacterium]
MTPRANPALVIAAAIVGGAAIAVIDARAEEVQWAVGLLLVLTAACSALAPRQWWMIALFAGACVPIAGVVEKILGIPTLYPVNPPWATLLAFIPATIGALIGGAIGGRFSAAPSGSTSTSPSAGAPTPRP